MWPWPTQLFLWFCMKWGTWNSKGCVSIA
jgi:hypothetical protein